MKIIHKKLRRAIMLTLLATSICSNVCAADNIFSRFYNNIRDTLTYRKLSLVGSAAGLGYAAYSSNPNIRYGVGTLSLLNVLRTWWTAPSRYTLEGVVEKAANENNDPTKPSSYNHYRSDKIMVGLSPHKVKDALAIALHKYIPNADPNLNNEIQAFINTINTLAVFDTIQTRLPSKSTDEINQLVDKDMETLGSLVSDPSKIRSNPIFQEKLRKIKGS